MPAIVYLEKEGVELIHKRGPGPVLTRVPADYGEHGIGEISVTDSCFGWVLVRDWVDYTVTSDEVSV